MGGARHPCAPSWQCALPRPRVGGGVGGHPTFPLGALGAVVSGITRERRRRDSCKRGSLPVRSTGRVHYRSCGANETPGAQSGGLHAPTILHWGGGYLETVSDGAKRRGRHPLDGWSGAQRRQKVIALAQRGFRVTLPCSWRFREGFGRVVPYVRVHFCGPLRVHVCDCGGVVETRRAGGREYRGGPEIRALNPVRPWSQLVARTVCTV